MPKKEVYEAIATLIGTVIGAGVLGIPYVVASAGFLTGLIVIFVICWAVTMMYLYYGEIVLRTKSIHQLTGYAEIYLGKYGKWLAAFSMIVGIYGALIAYILGVGESLKVIFGGSLISFIILFFVFVALLIYLGLTAIEWSEVILMSMVVGTMVIISLLAAPSVNLNNLNHLNLANILLPYGVIVFAFLGTSAIPEMREELVKNEKHLKKAILIGMLVPLVLYSVFTCVVVGVVGVNGFSILGENERIATVALGSFVGEHIFLLGNIFAVLAMSTSFLVLGLALKEMFMYDYKINKNIAWALTCFIPFTIALSKITNFIQIIGLTGALTGGINACLIVLMFWEAKKKGKRKPEYTLSSNKAIGLLIMFLLILGTVYGFLEFF